MLHSVVLVHELAFYLTGNGQDEVNTQVITAIRVRTDGHGRHESTVHVANEFHSRVAGHEIDR